MSLRIPADAYTLPLARNLYRLLVAIFFNVITR